MNAGDRLESGLDLFIDEVVSKYPYRPTGKLLTNVIHNAHTKFYNMPIHVRAIYDNKCAALQKERDRNFRLSAVSSILFEMDGLSV